MSIQTLFGSQNETRILFFLMVNGRCYASQLKHRFASPLTPLQYGLNKLEKEGLLLSYTEGKTRYFEFNPSYPLLFELEALLKKGYLLLPSEKKKLFYCPEETRPSRKPVTSSKEKEVTLREFWGKTLPNQVSLFFS